jgi:transposase InsO family protein
MTVPAVLDAAGRRRSPATMPGYHAGRPPRNKGLHYPADPPTVEEIVAVMREASDDRGDGIRVIRTPVRAPNANAHIERWVGSARRECLDRILIFNRRQLERVLNIYIRHYNERRPHRALDLQTPEPSRRASTHGEPAPTAIRRRDLLGGLIHEYEAIAA